MYAQPQTGVRAVGGATQYPWDALAKQGATRPWRLTRELPADHPTHAAMAALSWHANQAITKQVGATYALAILARSHAEAVATAGERNLPEGPLRTLVTGIAKWHSEMAKAAADAATGFGRRFGHLAFAFAPRKRVIRSPIL